MSPAYVQRTFVWMVESTLRAAAEAYVALRRRQGAELSFLERARLQRLLVRPGMKADHSRLRASGRD